MVYFWPGGSDMIHDKVEIEDVEFVLQWGTEIARQFTADPARSAEVVCLPSRKIQVVLIFESHQALTVEFFRNGMTALYAQVDFNNQRRLLFYHEGDEVEAPAFF